MPRSILTRVAILCAALTAPLVAQPVAYVSNFNDATVSLVDTITKIALAEIPVGDGPHGIAILPDASAVYVSLTFENAVRVIDRATFTATDTIPVGNLPFGLAALPDGSRVYVANGGDDTVSVIDTASNTVIATLDAPGSPFGVAIDPLGKFVYVAGSFDTLLVIDVATDAVHRVSIDGNLTGVAVHPRTRDAYLTDTHHNRILVFDPLQMAVIDELQLQSIANPEGLAFHPQGHTLYVENLEDFGNRAVLTAIDVATFSVRETVELSGFGSLGVAVHPNGRRVYVASGSNNTVAVIDTATHTVLTEIPVGSGPIAWGQFVEPMFLDFRIVGNNCPGVLTLKYTGADRGLELYRGTGIGSSTIVDGPCAGTELGLQDAEFVKRLAIDADSQGSLIFAPIALLCGKPLQVVDGSCNTSSVELVPN